MFVLLPFSADMCYINQGVALICQHVVFGCKIEGLIDKLLIFEHLLDFVIDHGFVKKKETVKHVGLLLLREN